MSGRGAGGRVDNSGEGVGGGSALDDSGGCASDSEGSSGRGVIATMGLKGGGNDGDDDDGIGEDVDRGIRSGAVSSGIGVDGVGPGLGSWAVCSLDENMIPIIAPNRPAPAKTTNKTTTVTLQRKDTRTSSLSSG